MARRHAGFAFPRDARMTQASEFRRVFSQPIRSTDAYFTILARLNAVGAARVGLAISKKCAPRAVDRNRLKRLARASFRLARADLPNIDIVVTCRRTAATAPNAQLATSLSAHWERIRDWLPCATS
jgi:ribonuclease P protein component